MRRRSIFGFLVVCAIVACSPSSRTMPPPPPGPGQVRMTLTCDSSGTLAFALNPWAVKLPNKNAHFTWISDPASNVDGVISAQNPQYPFGGQKLRAPHGGSVDGKPVKDTPADTYKYSVTVVCPVPSGPPDTTVIDPDMIIPWKIEAN